MVNRSQSKLLLPLLSVANFLAALDLFIVNVAFDQIGASLGGSFGDLSWILNAYTILYAALLVPLGRMADRFGPRVIFLGGLAVFVVGSAACAASPGLGALVAFRAVQAVGAAALTPASLGLLLITTPPERRVRAVRFWSAIGGLAAAAGPVAGGLLLELSWRWVFLVNVPIGVVALALAVWLVPHVRHDQSARIPDLLGAALLMVTVGALALAMVKGPDWGWRDGAPEGALAVAVLAGAWFGRRSARHAAPVLDLALLRVRTFAWSTVVTLGFTAGFSANLLANILWVQTVWHYSPLQTGLSNIPGPLMVPVCAFLAQRMSSRVPASWIASGGCLLFAIGDLYALFTLREQPHYAADALPSFLLTGMGVGFALPTLLGTATHDLPASSTSTGSAVLTTSQQIGAVLGVSVLVAILAGAVGYPDTDAHFAIARWAIAGTTLVAALAAAFGVAARNTSSNPRPDLLVATETVR